MIRLARAMAVGIAAWILGSGCFSVDPVQGDFACVDNSDCNPGWSCLSQGRASQKICVQGAPDVVGDSADAADVGAEADAEPDADVATVADTDADSAADADTETVADADADTAVDSGPDVETDAGEPGLLTGIWEEQAGGVFLTLEHTGDTVTGFGGHAVGEELYTILDGTFDGKTLTFSWWVMNGSYDEVLFDLTYVPPGDVLDGTSELQKDGAPPVDLTFHRYER